MSLDEFKLLRLHIVENVLLIEVMCTNVQGPEQAEAGFSRELAQTVEQEEEKPLLLDLHRASVGDVVWDLLPSSSS